jgi:hypothetical protein
MYFLEPESLGVDINFYDKIWIILESLMPNILHLLCWNPET